MLATGTVDRHSLARATPCDKQTASAEIRKLRKEPNIRIVGWVTGQHVPYPIVGYSDQPDVPRPERTT